jgi:CBS domain-containing protein
MKSTHTTVEDLMSTAVIAARPHEPLSKAREDMELANIHHLPVIDERDHVIGILSSHDLARALGGGRRSVADAMTRRVRTVGRGTPAHQAVALMLAHRIGSLPVVGEDEQLIGVITDTDFLNVARRALLGMPAIERR